MVALGHVPGSEVRIDPERLLLEELVVTGTRYATRAEISQTMELVQLGKITPIIGARVALEDLNHALPLGHNTFGRVMFDVTTVPVP